MCFFHDFNFSLGGYSCPRQPSLFQLPPGGSCSWVLHTPHLSDSLLLGWLSFLLYKFLGLSWSLSPIRFSNNCLSGSHYWNGTTELLDMGSVSPTTPNSGASNEIRVYLNSRCAVFPVPYVGIPIYLLVIVTGPQWEGFFVQSINFSARKSRYM